MSKRIYHKDLRFQQILEYLDSHKFATIQELSKICKVSPDTIRRDISWLQTHESIKQVHGGVISNERNQRNPFFLERVNNQYEFKKEIGETAATFVKDNETIFISGGTTTEFMIPHLAERKELTIITNSMNIVAKLVEYDQINVLVLGGQLHHTQYDLIGQLSEHLLTNLVASKIFRGIEGIHQKIGFTTNDALFSNIDRKILSQMGELIILADHTKFAKAGSTLLVPVKSASIIITDKLAPSNIVDEIKAMGVRVIQV